MRREKPDSLLFYAILAEKKSIDIQYSMGMGYALNLKGAFFFSKGNWPSALSNLAKARSYFSPETDPSLIDHNYMFTGLTYYAMRDLESALEYQKLCLSHCEKTENTVGISRAYNNLGLIHRELKEYEKAHDYVEKALSIHRGAKIIEWDDLGYSLNNLGYILTKLGKFKKAETTFMEALEIWDSIDNKNGKCYTLIDLSLLLKEQYDDRCVLLLQKALGLSTQLGNKRNIAVSQIELGKYYERKGENTKAIPLFSNALEVSRDIQLNEIGIIAASKLATYHEGQKNYKKAFDYQQLSITMGNSITKQTISNESMRKDFDFALKLVEEKRAKAKMVGGILAFALALLTGIAIALFISNREKFIANKRLALQKSKVEHTNKTQDKLIYTLAHDFQGPLCSLKGILNLINQGLLSLKEQAILLRKMESVVDNTSTHLNNLLTWASLKSKEPTLHLENVNLSTLIDDQIQEFASTAESNRITIKKTFESASPIILADKKMIVLATQNFLLNAFKCSNPGTDVTINISNSKGQITTEIIGQVNGMDQEKIESLFSVEQEIFTKKEFQTKKASYLGLGLGLSKSLIEKNKGTLEIESQEGGKTTIRFSFPNV